MPIVDLLRHGALVGGVRYRGRIDDPLTPEGRAAMDAVWQAVANEVELIVCSPLARCRQPAEDWAAQKGIALIVEDRLMELAYGDWEGKTAEEIEAQWGELFRRWRRNPAGLRPPGGESPEEMRARIQAWWHEFRRAHLGKRALVVAHSGTIRMLIAIVLGAGIETTRKMAMPYACWSRIAADEHADWLVFHNRTP